MIGHFVRLTELDDTQFQEQLAILENDVRGAYENLYENRNWQFLNVVGGLDEKILESIFIEENLEHPFNRDKVREIKELAIDYLVCRWKANTLKRQLNAEWKALKHNLTEDAF